MCTDYVCCCYFDNTALTSAKRQSRFRPAHDASEEGSRLHSRLTHIDDWAPGHAPGHGFKVINHPAKPSNSRPPLQGCVSGPSKHQAVSLVYQLGNRKSSLTLPPFSPCLPSFPRYRQRGRALWCVSIYFPSLSLIIIYLGDPLLLLLRFHNKPGLAWSSPVSPQGVRVSRTTLDRLSRCLSLSLNPHHLILAPPPLALS